MDDPPPFMMTPAYHGLAPPRGRQLRSTSTAITDSPTRQQRNTDDLLLNLTPRTAVEAFQHPSGALKTCFDAATPNEQAFALKVAIASNKIFGWLEELTNWSWPATGGSSGFEMPPVEKRRLDSFGSNVSNEKEDGASRPPNTYIGCLEATIVDHYEKRVDEINTALGELDIEEIKTQVLHNHIMPLSRPGTPLLDSGRSVASALSSLARMDDLTALLTATLMQALPNLSKLTSLLSIWSFRLLVLRKIPIFLNVMEDAEVALESGWRTIGARLQDNQAETDHTALSNSRMTRKEYEVIKGVLERKVAKAGQNLDAMLDILEGHQDTLPESWIDRVDTLEHEYGEWSVACEQKIREAEIARIVQEAPDHVEQEEEEVARKPTQTNKKDTAFKVAPVAAPPKAAYAEKSATHRHKESIESASSGREFFPYFNNTPEAKTEPRSMNYQLQDPERRLGQPISFDRPAIEVHHPSEDSEPSKRANPIRSSLDGLNRSKYSDCSGDEQRVSSFDGLLENKAWPRKTYTDDSNDDSTEPEFSSHEQGDENTSESPSYRSEDDYELTDGSDDYVAQPDLPALPRVRRDSDFTEGSTVIHEASLGRFTDFSSDQLDLGTPERPRRLMHSSAGQSPVGSFQTPSSPPLPRAGNRSMSVSFNDELIINRLPSIPSSPQTPQTLSLLEDESPHAGSPGQTRAPKSDDQLQQQISEILESVPAKIRLTREPPAVNLNPADFTMPTARKTSKPELKRSQSSMSLRSTGSRAGTPSFTLAPAFSRTSRPRPKGGNPEIKLYHLSRSNGEAPIKLFIRCVGEHGERVMVRVGGGWADLGEYLKEYASHHGRRSGVEGKVEVKDLPGTLREGSTPPSRPTSSLDVNSPVSPLRVRKTRKPAGTSGEEAKTPLAMVSKSGSTPSSGDSMRSTSSSTSRRSWPEEDISLGMAGPRAKRIEMSEESKAWVESVKHKVRIASGERKPPPLPDPATLLMEGKFGEIGKVGATKRLFRKGGL
ncbi:hypothetical protein QBC35DRAFT_165991 [Podospora australis]|uniref:GAR domain-containing protein n=1 Tax=Podospora australis TaxID=1536484 RepID=A0AAN7ALI2_9PEZI|nr:hypothetical protein QBC35DRAFT_165991 [Podospora australis]